MKQIIKAIAILTALSLLALPVFGQMGTGGMMGADSMMSGKAKDMMNRGQTMRSQQGIMGMGFMHSAGSSFGHYVTFSVDNKTGTVNDSGISGITVFNSIKIAGFNFKDSVTMGAMTKIISKDGSVIMQLYDNPAAVINIHTKAATNITFELAEGVNATKEGNMVRIKAGNLTAFIASTNNTAINVGSGEVRIESSRGNAIFRAVPVNMPMDGLHQKFMGEMMNNRAGAEVSVGASDTYCIANYSENMNVMIRSMEKNRMSMSINSTDPSGKFIMMDLDNSSLTWTERQKIHLYLDNKPMRQVMTPDELFAARESSFWLTMPGNNRMQAMMYIANFSERVVDVVVEEEGTPAPAGTTEAPEPAAATPTPGFGIVIGLLGAGLVYYLRRK
jgi:hypothetical protein